MAMDRAKNKMVKVEVVEPRKDTNEEMRARTQHKLMCKAINRGAWDLPLDPRID